MRWRGLAIDGLLAAAGVGLDVLTTWHTWGGSSASISLCTLYSVVTGLPMALVRHRPAAVVAFLAGWLVVADQVAPFTANTVQMLLLVALGALAHGASWRLVVPCAALAAVATGFNLADPGIAFTRNAWFYSVGAAVVPVIIGRYLRGTVRHLDEPDVTPDVLLAIGGVALAVLGTWTDWADGSVPVWVAGSLAVIGGLSLGVARRLPGIVLVFQTGLLMAAIQYLPQVSTTCMVLALIAVCVFAMRVASWFWIGLVYLLAAFLASSAIVRGDAEITPVRVVVLMAMVAAPVAIGRYLGARASAVESERLRLRESQRLAIAQLRADQLAERERIARDVHDIVAHHVGAMVLRAGAARYAAPEGPVADALTDIRDAGHQALEDLRGLLDLLRDPERAPALLADPADVVRESAERMTAAGLIVELDLDPRTEQAPLVARASAARIVQEGLTNVLKHAGPGTPVRVSLAVGDGGLAVEVRNGRPPVTRESLPSSGQGLAGMRERARALGGTLSAGPDAEGGWRLAVTLPARGLRGTT